MPMIEESDSRQKILSRQISAQRRNLVIVCRFAIKTLIDKAALTTVDDECEELTNFFAILEQILNHRIKAQKSWYGTEEPGSFWSYIQAACKSVPRSCISGIASLDNVKPATAKGRAWLRCVLMEKRLSEYLTTAIHNTRFTRMYYLDGAIMLSEDAPILFAELLGLNAIDFSFCLKGDNLDLSTPMVVDYSPYLKFEQSRESIIHDEEELHTLSMQSSINSRVSAGMTEEELGYVQKYRLLDQKYRNACEQKGYLEELLRLRENQLDAIQQQNQDMACTIRQLEKEGQKDRKELEGVIIELQEQLSSMKLKCAHLQESLTYLPGYPTSPSKLDQSKLIPMEDLGSIRSLSLSPAMAKHLDCDQQSLSSLESSLPPVTSTSTNTNHHGYTNHHSYSEDTQSMIPLTGSLTSQQSGKSTEYISFGLAVTKDIDVITPLEHASGRETKDSVSGPSTLPERPNQSKGLSSELYRDYLLDTDVEQADRHTDTDKIISSRDLSFINDNISLSVEESFFVLSENSETVRNQDRQPIEHSSHDSGEINAESEIDQGQVTQHSFVDTDLNDSAEIQISQMLLIDILEEIEKSEKRAESEEKSDSDTSTLDDTEFVLLDQDTSSD